MRGKAEESHQAFLPCGITPAYAGKSCVLCAVVVWQQDHPRLCGEKLSAFLVAVHTQGSPPPMRGKAVQCGAFASCSGITPAYAGKSKNCGHVEMVA